MDTKVSKNTTSISTNTAAIGELKDLSNITATGNVTVGSKDATRRIQNVSAGLVGPNSTDAVNSSQLYALTRQIRFGGDKSIFGKTTAADDQNVVAGRQ